MNTHRDTDRNRGRERKDVSERERFDSLGLTHMAHCADAQLKSKWGTSATQKSVSVLAPSAVSTCMYVEHGQTEQYRDTRTTQKFSSLTMDLCTTSVKHSPITSAHCSVVATTNKKK